jgi:hypothetical protein
VETVPADGKMSNFYLRSSMNIFSVGKNIAARMHININKYIYIGIQL